jgi:cell division protein ZapA (FtsZ GTPase activity inhibitor)
LNSPITPSPLLQVTPDEEEKYIEDLTREFDRAFSDLLDSTPELRTTLSQHEVDAAQGGTDMEANIAETMEKLFRDAAAAGDQTGGQSGDEPGVEGMVPVLENLLGKLLSKEVGDLEKYNVTSPGSLTS